MGDGVADIDARLELAVVVEVVVTADVGAVELLGGVALPRKAKGPVSGVLLLTWMTAGLT